MPHFTTNIKLVHQIIFYKVLDFLTKYVSIVYKENSDKRINTEIENIVNGWCMRRLKIINSSQKTSQPEPVDHAPTDQVFSTNDFWKRTDKFYSNFAKDTLETDIEKEIR